MLRLLAVVLTVTVVGSAAYLLPRSDARDQVMSVTRIVTGAFAEPHRQERAGSTGSVSSSASTSSHLASTSSGQDMTIVVPAPSAATDVDPSTASTRQEQIDELERQFRQLNGLPVPVELTERSDRAGDDVANTREPTVDGLVSGPTTARQNQVARVEAAQRWFGGTKPTEDAAGWSTVTTRDAASVAGDEELDEADLARVAQTGLQRLGCYTSSVDGIWGRGSRAAVARFNSAAGLEMDRYAPSATLVRVLASFPDGACDGNRQRRWDPDRTILASGSTPENGLRSVDDRPRSSSPGLISVTVRQAQPQVVEVIRPTPTVPANTTDRSGGDYRVTRSSRNNNVRRYGLGAAPSRVNHTKRYSRSRSNWRAQAFGSNR